VGPMEGRVRLRAVDSLDVTILVDNSIDLLMAGSDRVKRAPMVPDWSEREQLIAEHGYSALLTIRERGTTRHVLYDAGLGKDTLLHNMGVLGLAVKDLDAIVLSHGHADHHGGLLGMVQALGKRNLPLVLHPDAWRVRQANFGGGVVGNLPPPDRARLEAADVQLLEEKGPSLLVGDGVLVTGQVERTTEFETGFPVQTWRNHDGRWEPDPWTWDDQPVVVHVKGKGLVVVSGCSHAGLINILRHARKVTGVDPIAGVIGGLHLTGKLFEPVIAPTLAELGQIRPELIVPGHCTGWRATHEIAREMPQAYVPTSVGTTVRF
jgi:7,8-dihydropterin-6-yl-methyl-4-(beta-D-ribofuranosyl)aminobenzene 5'-phosphate synthase